MERGSILVFRQAGFNSLIILDPVNNFLPHLKAFLVSPLNKS